MKRLLALLLAFSLLFTAVPLFLAADKDKTDEELIRQFNIPNNWARPALLFALHNGLLSGKSETNLAPGDNATRAEVAAILMRIVQTKTQADLSSFTDMQPNAWYYSPLAQAAAVGLISGNGAGSMLPNTKITREQAFSLLARAFGIFEGGLEDLYAFSDWYTVSSWAVDSVAALVRCGSVSGSGGKLNPKAYISRQELAQVLYGLLSGLGNEIGKEQNGNYALAAQSVPKGTVVHGDLILCGEEERIDLENITVEGRLVIQGCGSVTLTLTDCTVQTLVLCRQTTLLADDGIGSVQTNSDLVLSGEALQITVYGGNTTIAADGSAGQLTVKSDGTELVVDGTAAQVDICGANTVVSGSGMIDELQICCENCEVSCPTGTQTTALLPSLRGFSAVRTDTNKPTYTAPSVTLQVSFTAADTQRICHPCRLFWIVDGKTVKTEENFTVKNGAQTTYLLSYPDYILYDAQKLPVCVIATAGEQMLSCSFSVDVSNAAVRTSRVQATVTKATGLFYDYNDVTDTLTYWVRNIPAGTSVYYLNKYMKVAKIRLHDGQEGWVRLDAVQIKPGPDYTTSDYSTEVKEYFVNEAKGYSSSSKYLVWVNIWCQQINIFEGSQGNWKLIRTADCATGKNYTASPIGVQTIRKKTPQVDGGSYYYHHATWMSGTLALHSRLYYYGGGFYDATIGRPVSNGCIRLYDQDCIWIYDNVPVGSTVVIY